MRWSIFMLVRTTPAWLALPREKRGEIAAAAFSSALPDESVTMRYFDAEAFSGRCTDVVLFETENPAAYYFAIERLRDSALFSVPYFEVVDIIPTVEEGFRAFEAAEAGVSS